MRFHRIWRGGGLAYIPPKCFPNIRTRTRGDQIAQCLAACRKYGGSATCGR
jgi:hypothetical protein